MTFFKKTFYAGLIFAAGLAPAYVGTTTYLRSASSVAEEPVKESRQLSTSDLRVPATIYLDDLLRTARDTIDWSVGNVHDDSGIKLIYVEHDGEEIGRAVYQNPLPTDASLDEVVEKPTEKIGVYRVLVDGPSSGWSVRELIFDSDNPYDLRTKPVVHTTRAGTKFDDQLNWDDVTLWSVAGIDSFEIQRNGEAVYSGRVSDNDAGVVHLGDEVYGFDEDFGDVYTIRAWDNRGRETENSFVVREPVTVRVEFIDGKPVMILDK